MQGSEVAGVAHHERRARFLGDASACAREGGEWGERGVDIDVRTSWVAVVCLSAVEGRGDAVYWVCKDGLGRVMLEATQNPDAFAKLRRGSKGLGGLGVAESREPVPSLFMAPRRVYRLF